MPFKDRLGLDDDDGVPPCRKQSRGEEEAKSVSQTQSWPAGAASEDIELVAEGSILDDKFASRATGEVGGDLEQFNTGRKRGESRRQPAAGCQDAGGDRGDCHGEVGPRFG